MEDIDKLELKHLAPYLPYKLRIYRINKYIGGSNDQQTLSCAWLEDVLSNDSIHFDAKPVLKPMSDLSIDHYNMIYDSETDYTSICSWLELDVESRLMSKFSLEFWNGLYRHHFDVFGLIEKGLAVDIHTISL